MSNLYFASSRISPAPMLRPEIEYWLFKGETIFRHRGINWVRVFDEQGNRILLSAPASELARVRKHLYTEHRGIIRGVKR